MSDQIALMLLKMEIPKLMKFLGKTYIRRGLGASPNRVDREPCITYDLTHDRWRTTQEVKTGEKKEMVPVPWQKTRLHEVTTPIFETRHTDPDWSSPMISHAVRRLYLNLKGQCRERMLDELVAERLVQHEVEFIEI